MLADKSVGSAQREHLENVAGKGEKEATGEGGMAELLKREIVEEGRESKERGSRRKDRTGWIRER